MIKFGARHLHWYWRQTSFQKDKGHTESRTSGLTDYFGIEWTSGVLSWRLCGFALPPAYTG
jgi:hypothetical protein